MDYSWLTELNQVISQTKVFSFTIIGAKSLAMTLLLFKIIGNFLQTGENPEAPKIGGIISIIGYGLIIVGSDWVVNAIETMFSSVDVSVAAQHPLKDDALKRYLLELDKIADQYSGLDYIGFYLSLIPLYLTAGLMTFTKMFLDILDMAVVGMYLIQRVFLIQLFKVIFPFAIALSTTKGFEDMLSRWIKIYIGLFVLGIGYMGIMKFSDIIYDFVQSKANVQMSDIGYDTDLGVIFAYTVGALLISFMVKLGLFAIVTKEIRGYFS